MRSSLYTLGASMATAMAAVRGFNYGSQGQTYETFLAQFQAANNLVGAEDFTSARLYTMIQESTSNTVISAIPAAIASNTTLLLGLWASVDQAAFNNELTALKNAINQYPELAKLVVGISVGSEDLYRISPTGIAAGSGYGQTPDTLVKYIGQVRQAISGSILSSKPVGHVDTWNDFVNGSNSAVIAASDFLGLDEYPYYQTTDANSIDNAGKLFFEAYDKVAASSQGKPIWITEAGWPTKGPKSGDAVASVANAQKFWQDVACQLISRGIDFWWYILADAGLSPEFGVVPSLGSAPYYDLSCGAKSSSSASASSTRSASSVAQATTPTSAAASTTVNISNPVPTVIGTGASGAANATGGAVYVTAVTTVYTTTCPAGFTLTQGGSTTVLQSASVITTTGVVSKTVSSGVVGVTGTAASGSGSVPGATGASTLASTWASGQTPSATRSGAATFTGAATKVDGSMAALALGAVAAVFAL